MKTNNRQSHNKKIRLLVILFVAAGVIALAAILLLWRQSTDRSSTNTKMSAKPGQSKEATSEGTTFPVPDDLPDNAIQDYVLVTENEEYKIRRYGDTNRYTITLYAIINNPDQYSMYKDQLREYKQHALAYLKDKGVDTSQIEVTYEPGEASNL